MKRHGLVVLATALTAVLSGATAMATEFPDHTIVVSDNWCAPSGDCNACDPGHLVKAAHCHNSYCDNMIYACADPGVYRGASLRLKGGRWFDYEYASEEDGEWSQDAVCPFGQAMVGMYSYGNWSDNVEVLCQQVDLPTDVTGYMTRGPYSISEEQEAWAQFGWWLNGASCTGSNCDNMWYWYTQLY